MASTNSGCKTAKSKHTRGKIIDAYLNLIVSKHWTKITVKEICENASITRGTFYQYFDDIFDLMEQIEAELFADIKERYALAEPRAKVSSPELFEKQFDCEPPYVLLTWFEFCKNHRKAMAVMLDPKHGDTYFVKRLKVIIDEQINNMMDEDGIPRGALRHHFVKIFIELHFLSARSWLDSETEDFLETDEIISLLNSMRVGASYLTYKGYIKDLNV